MKKLRFLLLFAVACLVISSCALLGVQRGTVRFTAGDQTITLELGFVETDGEPMIEILPPDDVVLFAANEVTDFDEPDAYILVDWTGSGTGTVTARFSYYQNSPPLSLVGDVSLEVLSWKDVGGYCTGTFSGTVQNALSEDVEITKGGFIVMRAPDDTFGF